MRKVILLILILLIGAGSAQARVNDAKYHYGLGVIIGEPTGFSGKYWLNNKEAYDLSVSFRFSSYLYLSGAYLYHNYDVFKNAKYASDASLYYGAGLRLIGDREHRYRKHFRDDTYDTILGLRGTIGLSYFIPNQPFEIFIEFSPLLNIAPATDLDFSAGVGARCMW
ncbi:MAG: hypothetical protein HY920_05280 [Elusimicrobia bacterium]|nr:hypothetical protein [Elusimicrobiota bacterium]